MDFISQIPIFGGFVATVLSFVIVIGIVVFVHEYGHYIVGRWCGIHSETFSLGFGPVIWSRMDKRGTKWQLAAFPLGGYVKFVGDRNAASEADQEAMAKMSSEERAHSFPGAKVHKRALTVLAGPVANLVLSVIVFAGLVTWQGVVTDSTIVGEVIEMPGDQSGLLTGDEILKVEGKTVSSFGEIYEVIMGMEEPGAVDVVILRDGSEMLLTIPYLFPPAIYGVEPMSAASDAGIEAGDVILSANGVDLVAFAQLREVVEASEGKSIPLKVWRAGKVLDLVITPKLIDFPTPDGGFEKRVMIGISGAFSFLPLSETPNPIKALSIGAERVFDVLKLSLSAIRHIITGDISAKNLQGPLGIAQMAEETANQGLVNFISFIAIISAGIGLLNILPIPVLDGGHLMFFLIEAIRGEPPSEKIIQIAMTIGLALVLFLMVFVTGNDIMRL